MQSFKEHDQLFGTLSPTPLFFRLAVPSMISMAVTSLYTIADGVFVGYFRRLSRSQSGYAADYDELCLIRHAGRGVFRPNCHPAGQATQQRGQ